MNHTKMAAVYSWAACILLPMAGLAAEKALPPRAEADMVRCETPPRIDGDLSDACWAKATKLGSFCKLGTGEDAGACQASICADDQWLYVSYDVALPNVNKMQTTVLDHDAQVCQDDSVELFIDPGTESKLYYQFMLNAANVQAERKCYSAGNKDYAWSIPWRSATRVTDKGWQAEIAIPLGFLAKEPTWKNMTINLGVTRLLLTLNSAGERVAIKYDYSCWSAVKGTFHEANRFGLIHKLESFKAQEAFMAMVEQTRVGKYSLMENGGFGYKVSGVLRNASDLPGKVALVVEDKPAAGRESVARQEFSLKPSESLPFTFTVPVVDFSARTATIKIQDAASAEIFQSYGLREVADLRLMRSYSRLSYFTSEKDAEITCEFGLDKDSVKKLKLSAKAENGRELAGAGADAGKLLVPMKDLALGKNKVIATLCQADGKELARQEVVLVKRAPKPGCEYKMDLANKVLLDNGTPFFPFGIMFGVGTTGTNLEPIVKDVADAGFNTIVRWAGVDYSNRADLYDLTAKYNIKMVDTTESYGNKSITKEQLAPRTNMSSMEKRALVQDLISLPGALSMKDRPNLIAWYLADEPSTSLENAALNLRQYQKLYEQDGYHPAEILQVPPTPEGEPYSSNCDIFGIDPYWIPGAGAGDIGSPHRVGYHTWYLRCKADRDLKLAWITPTAERWSGINMRIVLGQEQCAQTYLSLIHGAKGLLYFVYPFFAQGTHDTFARLGREMKLLGPACVAPELEQEITYSPVVWDPLNGSYPDVQMSLKRNPAGGYLLLAANWRPYPVEAGIAIPALAGLKKITLPFDAGRELTVEAGKFSDTLDPMGTRAYAIDARDLSEPVAIAVNLKKQTEKTDPLYAALGEDNPRRGVKNFFANSGFEQDSSPGMPDYCTFYFLGASRVGGNSGIGVVTNQPYEGKKCLRLANGVMVNYTIKGQLQPNVDTPAVFSVYARTDDEKGATVSLDAPDTKGKWNADGQRSGTRAKVTKEWTRISLPLIVPAASPAWGWHFRVNGGNYGKGKGVYIDAMQLEKGTEATGYER